MVCFDYTYNVGQFLLIQFSAWSPLTVWVSHLFANGRIVCEIPHAIPVRSTVITAEKMCDLDQSVSVWIWLDFNKQLIFLDERLL